jgi:hypothetical protein
MKLLCAAAFLLSGMGTSIAAAQQNATEVDLVFPRADETYQRVYPFPIVFAIQNPAPIWPNNFQLTWRTGPVDDESAVDFGLFPGKGNGLWTIGNYYGPKTVTEVWAAGIYKNSTAQKWYLSWQFTLRPNCSVGSDGTVTLAKQRPVVEGKIFFTINEKGKMPDVYQGAESSTCPRALGVFNVVGEQHSPLDSAQYGDKNSTLCPVFGAVPAPDPCAAKATPELEKKVMVKMLQMAGCDDVKTWPDASLRGPCRGGENGGDKGQNGGDKGSNGGDNGQNGTSKGQNGAGRVMGSGCGMTMVTGLALAIICVVLM